MHHHFPLCSLNRQCAIILCCYSTIYLKERMTGSYLPYRRHFLSGDDGSALWQQLACVVVRIAVLLQVGFNIIYILVYWTFRLLRINGTLNFVLLWEATFHCTFSSCFFLNQICRQLLVSMTSSLIQYFLILFSPEFWNFSATVILLN